MLVSIGGNAILECQATGVPPPLVHWFKGMLRPATVCTEKKREGKCLSETCGLWFSQMSLRLALLLMWSKMYTTGLCTFEGCRRSTQVNTAVWPVVQLELPLALSACKLEVRIHFCMSTKTLYLTSNWHKGKFTTPSTAGPLFSEAPADVTANIGENVTLPCTAWGLPQPTVTWSRPNGGQILTRADSHTMQLENGHLLIQGELSMKHYHSRELWCALQASPASWLPCTDWHDWNFLSVYI